MRNRVLKWAAVIISAWVVLLPVSVFALVGVDTTQSFHGGGTGEVSDSFNVGLASGDTLLECQIVSRGDGDLVSGVTYNGATMTQFFKIGPYDIGEGGANSYTYGYYIYSPASGTNAVAMSYSSGSHDDVYALCYGFFGSAVSGFPDAQTGVVTTTGTNLAFSLTPSVANVYVVGFAVGDVSYSSVSGCTARFTSALPFVCDSNGVVSGAQSFLITTGANTHTVYGEAFSVAPPGGGAGGSASSTPPNAMGALFLVNLGYWFIALMELLLVFIPIYVFLCALMAFVTGGMGSDKHKY